MNRTEAASIFRKLNPNTAFRCRWEFVRSIAAFVVIFPEQLNNKSGKTTVHALLVSACSPSRIEWYLNESRFRSQLPPRLQSSMSPGTTRNEAFHAHMKRHFVEPVRISQVYVAGRIAHAPHLVTACSYTAALW